MARSFVLLLVACSAFAQERVQLEVPRGSVGAVFVRGTTGDATDLTVVFPASVVENPGGGWIESGETATKGPVEMKGELVLFDDAGVVHRFFSGPFQLRFWCHNDGGLQARPELKLSLVLPRTLKPNEALGGLAGFVVVARSGKTPTLPKVKAKAKELLGDLDGDGKPEAAIQKSWSTNCDPPMKGTQLSLITGTSDEALRCCGP